MCGFCNLNSVATPPMCTCLLFLSMKWHLTGLLGDRSRFTRQTDYKEELFISHKELLIYQPQPVVMNLITVKCHYIHVQCTCTYVFELLIMCILLALIRGCYNNQYNYVCLWCVCVCVCVYMCVCVVCMCVCVCVCVVQVNVCNVYVCVDTHTTTTHIHDYKKA